jgi:diaminopimelate epimerase
MAKPDNPRMQVKFTKMQGAGNDFVVLDATQAPLDLNVAQLRLLGDRRFGVGADQILVVEKSVKPGIDFRYRIFNGANGDEVEQCGNGARCFVRYVVDKGLSTKSTIRVETINSLLELRLQADGRVTVDMGAPIFDLQQIPFDPKGATPRRQGDFELWPLADIGVDVAVLSMGNPHAVQLVADVDAAPVATVGPSVEHDAHFPRRVNAGFMQVVSRSQIRLRVYERDAGETLACGTGACAAVVAGIRLGLLDPKVDVEARGGRLTIEWNGMDNDPSSAEHRGRSPEGTAPGLGRPGARAPAPVLMTGPAETVYEGQITL